MKSYIHIQLCRPLTRSRRRGRRGGEGGKRRGGTIKIPSRYPYQSFKDKVADSVCILCHNVKQSIECVS